MHVICIIVLHTWHKNISNIHNINYYTSSITCIFIRVGLLALSLMRSTSGKTLCMISIHPKVIGFVNLGDVDRQLSALEFDSSQSPPTIATRILTLMVRGVFSKLHFPLANFPTAGIRTCVLHDILWEATELLHSDFIVCFQTGDGGSPHRRLVLGN